MMKEDTATREQNRRRANQLLPDIHISEASERLSVINLNLDQNIL
jgi:hypothetical protein